jgi:hypothetical protein
MYLDRIAAVRCEAHITCAMSHRTGMARLNVRMESRDRFEFNWYPASRTSYRAIRDLAGSCASAWRLRLRPVAHRGAEPPHRVLQGGTTTWFRALDLFDDL